MTWKRDRERVKERVSKWESEGMKVERGKRGEDAVKLWRASTATIPSLVSFYTSDRADDWTPLFSGIPSRSRLNWNRSRIYDTPTLHDESIPAGLLRTATKRTKRTFGLSPNTSPIFCLLKFLWWCSEEDARQIFSQHKFFCHLHSRLTQILQFSA